MTHNTAGLNLGVPAFITTAALSGDTTKYAGLGTTFNGANISGSMTMNTAGLQLSMSVAAPGGGGGIGIAAGTRTATTANTLLFDNANGVTFGLNAVAGSIMTASVAAQSVQAMNMYAVSNTTGASSSSTMDARSISFQGAGIASVGFTNGSVVISVPAGGGAGDGYNIVSMLSSTSGGGTAGATFSNSAASIGLMAGSNITLSQTSNTIVFNAPNSSSLVGASGMSISTNGSTISIYESPRSSMVFPTMALSVLGAMGNGSLSIAYRDVLQNITATRVDCPFFWSQATTATTNTVAIAMTVLAAIYTRNVSTLSSMSSASTQTTYSYASNSAGVTALSVAVSSWTAGS